MTPVQGGTRTVTGKLGHRVTLHLWKEMQIMIQANLSHALVSTRHWVPRPSP